jgi:hypothetical protein
MVSVRSKNIGADTIRRARRVLGENREGFARLLGTSADRVRRLEVGLDAPPDDQIQLLAFVLAAERVGASQCPATCWQVRGCTPESRSQCGSYQLNHGHLCWLLAKGFCSAESHIAKPDVASECRDCSVYQILAVNQSDLNDEGERVGDSLCIMPRPERALSSR